VTIDLASGISIISRKGVGIDMARLFNSEDVVDDIKFALDLDVNIAVTKSYTTDQDKEIPKNELHLFCYDDCWFRVVIEEMEKQP